MADWYYVKVDLQQPSTLFGSSFPALFLTAFNSIALAPQTLHWPTAPKHRAAGH